MACQLPNLDRAKIFYVFVVVYFQAKFWKIGWISSWWNTKEFIIYNNFNYQIEFC